MKTLFTLAAFALALYVLAQIVGAVTAMFASIALPF